MWPVFPGSLTLMVVGAMLMVVLFAMRFVQPEWWSSRAARIGVLAAFGGLMMGAALWGAGSSLGHVAMVRAGAGMTYVGVLVLLPAALVMPAAAAFDRGLLFATRRRAGTVHEVLAVPKQPKASNTTRLEVTRRAMIRFGSASLPAMAAMGSASGFIQAKNAPTMPVVRLRFPGLHPDLEGLRILQLSDLHLGPYLGLEVLARGLEVARTAHRPDLIVLTGDLAEDVTLIPGALRLVAEQNARYGALASLGNHEYLNDITVTRPLYEASPIPLLVATGRLIRIGRATLFVGGADDPVVIDGDISRLLTPSIEAAAAAATAPADADFRLLLCHRPEGFGPAAMNGFDLTLAGHTHGGQLGLFGRSIFETLRPGIGWWGTYSKRRPPEIERARQSRTAAGPSGSSRLYTTSGFGHWFPFRVGCPTEMPLIVLEGDERKRPQRDPA